ncbi:MAG: Spx/MgsR family RNA polymerase-binding regulatory protein [Bacteroidia bacterium]
MAGKIIYGIKNCNTMQKAFESLKKQGIEFEFHDYKKSGISEEKIREWFSKADWEKFINRQGLTWKKLSDSEKEAVKTAEDAIKLMMEKTSLIKRPVLELGKKLIIGLDPKVYP